MSIAPGTQVGRYEIRSLLGAGGMGEVYLAEDPRLHRKVALKILPANVASDQERLRRFNQEATAAAALSHPNIAHIYEVGEAAGVSFIAMELVEGETLRQRLKRAPMAVDEVLDTAVQLAAALSTAHAAGIVHRDVKPENVMTRGDSLVKLLDFGLAKLTERGTPDRPDAGAETRLQTATEIGVVLGTALYMSPEQARGLEVDARTDIFSLGVLVYEMVVGRLPFEGANTTEVLASMLSDKDPPPLARSARDVPAELERITAKALRKNRDERYQAIADLLIDLKRLRREREVQGALKLRARPSARVWTAAAVGALALVSATVLYVSRKPARTPGLTAQDTILLVDFDNKTGDEIFDGALRQGLAVQLQQSPFLNLFSDAQARQTLRLMNRSPDERMTREIGRDICQRQELKALIAGTIARFDRNYSLALEAVNCQTGDTIALTQVEADGKDKVLAALSKAAAELRGKLGESLSSIQKSDVAIFQLTTGSLDALKAFSLAFDRSNRGKYFESVPLFRHATELDPNFAYAYALLAGNYTILNEPRHAAENATKAFELRDRVSEKEKLYVANYYSVCVTGDLDKSIEALDVYKRTYPKDFRAPGNLSLSYLLLGQYEKTVAEATESLRLNPNISAWHVTLGWGLVRLDRFADARRAFERALQMNLDDARLHTGLYHIGFIEGDTRTLQQQLEWASGKPEEYVAAELQAGGAAYGGRWRQAQDFARRAIDLAVRVDVNEVAAREAADQALRAAAIGRCDQARTSAAQSLALERNQVTRARVALTHAICGGSSQAQALMDEMRERHARDTIANGLWLPTIRAALELGRGNAAKAVEALEETRHYEPAGEFWTHTLRGQSYLKLNKGSEAAEEFQQIVDHRGHAPLSVLYPLARLGLARAAAQTSDNVNARRLYQEFVAMWKDADPDIPVLEATNKEYRKIK